MDQNKTEKLREIQYRIERHCGICRYSDLEANKTWGSCSLHFYEHGKHSDPEMPLSVHRAGSCSAFKLDEAKVEGLGLHGFKEFLGPCGTHG